ncbi:MAG: carbohydrate ABC transporter substrate-binding protein, partial [Acidobacteria bacterium]|nr:carbohydrate ABC transporter substrate-binding protein [Acidobacteriota bacterium]
SYRPDLLADAPRTWTDVLELAREERVVMPGFPADVFLNFMGFCVTLGGTFAHEGGAFIECDAGLAALDVLRELAARLPPQVWDWNPIAMYEAMGSSEAHAYCPFAYTYSNYARVAFVPHPLRFAEPPTLEGYGPVRTILGGTGLAVSRRCRHIDTALVYALAVSGAEWQRGIYALAGGQPAHRLAWSDRLLNDVTGDFFSTTRASVERAVVRPRCPGYTEFQAAAGKPVVEYLRRGGPARRVIADLDGIYQTFCRQSGAI